MTSFRHALGALLTCASIAGASAAPAVSLPAEPYAWKNVAIGGGGFVDGLVFHPALAGLVYARTDMGGAYRRDPGSTRWQPLLDGLSYADLNLMGVESLAVDPSDADKVYLACGTYTAPDVPDGAVLRSADRGRTFQRTPLPLKFGGNEEGRGNGERLAVDPNDGRVLFLGTRHAGLWASTDGAASFHRVASFPVAPHPGRSNDGAVVFVLFDPASGAHGRPSATLYAGVADPGRPAVWRSRDGGLTWQALPGPPTSLRPTRAALATDGHLYVSLGDESGPRAMGDGAVWRFDTHAGTWTDITPDRPGEGRRFGYAAVAVDAHDPRRVIASTFHRPHGEEIFRSLDGGTTWRPVLAAGAVLDASLAPYVKDTPLHWLFDIEIDPSNPQHAMFTTGYGGWETFDLGESDRGRPTHWQVMSTGIEETVALALLSPTAGVPLVTAIGDYSGFVHHDLDRPPPEGNPKPPFLGNTHDVAGAELDPRVIVRIGSPRGGGHLGYSLDGGSTWQEPASEPAGVASQGSIAVSADGATWVWTSKGQVPWVTGDRGTHWRPVAGLPAGTRVVADRVDPRRFHAMSLFGGTLYRSDDAGAHFEARPLDLPDGPVARGGSGAGHRGDERGGQDRLYATPGRSGDLWLAAFHGLYHAPDGATFARMPDVEEVHAFGFGRAAPGATFPALYLVGTVAGQRGVFRSDDAAAHWVRINDDAHQWGLVLQVTGDPKRYGRVYVGTHGRGVLYGDPMAR